MSLMYGNCIVPGGTQSVSWQIDVRNNYSYCGGMDLSFLYASVAPDSNGNGAIIRRNPLSTGHITPPMSDAIFSSVTAHLLSHWGADECHDHGYLFSMIGVDIEYTYGGCGDPDCDECSDDDEHERTDLDLLTGAYGQWLVTKKGHLIRSGMQYGRQMYHRLVLQATSHRNPNTGNDVTAYHFHFDPVFDPPKGTTVWCLYTCKEVEL